MILNREQVIHLAADRSCCSLKDTEAVMNAVLDVIADALRCGDDVGFRGFGKFRSDMRPERRHKLPFRTILLPARRRVKFIPSKKLAS